MKKEVSDEVAKKDESLLQIDTMIFMGLVKHSQSSQKSKFVISLNNISKNKLEMNLIFLI